MDQSKLDEISFAVSQILLTYGNSSESKVRLIELSCDELCDKLPVHGVVKVTQIGLQSAGIYARQGPVIVKMD